MSNLRWWNEPTGRDAFVLSLLSLVITLVAALCGIIASNKLGSSLLLVYGLENLVDFMSSAIVLWRFNLPNDDDPTSSSATAAVSAPIASNSPTNNTNTNATTTAMSHTDMIMNHREKRASVGISIVLAFLGFGTVISASEHFANGHEQNNKKENKRDLYALYYISFISVIVFAPLAKLKLHYAQKLKSSSLKKDGICSAVGAILSTSLFLNTVLEITSSGSLWWLDPLIALSCGIGSLVYGLWGIYKAYVRDGIPICTCGWWLYGGGSTSSTSFSPTTESPAISASDEKQGTRSDIENGNGNIGVGTGTGNGNGTDVNHKSAAGQVEMTTNINQIATTNSTPNDDANGTNAIDKHDDDVSDELVLT